MVPKQSNVQALQMSLLQLLSGFVMTMILIPTPKGKNSFGESIKNTLLYIISAERWHWTWLCFWTSKYSSFEVGRFGLKEVISNDSSKLPSEFTQQWCQVSSPGQRASLPAKRMCFSTSQRSSLLSPHYSIPTGWNALTPSCLPFSFMHSAQHLPPLGKFLD